MANQQSYGIFSKIIYFYRFITNYIPTQSWSYSNQKYLHYMYNPDAYISIGQHAKCVAVACMDNCADILFALQSPSGGK